ncbi:polyamine aminopropyltransferase [Actinobacteria bacterium YIM 96077]|uniref:Polyamine aminopropyltransferase n=1 Tax=Phytoactinopolyspora halophila TaxID=1981511 RepID=A0A329QFT0_9ACTN|nr:polyamine aminopropyltransferase [Phytoactinopolyspora halophila]AYY13084.1 polyamine aminopropyltransferase [Actinobacteria bacterium YIM 96077]RAW11096.1 polyamine aminopropyltransferase [Phytoactinopolyspora halophila]
MVAPAAPPAHRSRPARVVILGAALLCAACGLVYELALIALGSYLIGDTIVHASIVVSVMVFAMGIGSLVAKPLQRFPAFSFAAVEAALALVGGYAVLTLYNAFAVTDTYMPVMIVFATIIGTLIGAEIPLLMTLLQRIRAQEAGSAVADMFAADYLGALVGGLAFPFLLLPTLGLVTGTIATAALNLVAGTVVVLWLFRRSLARRAWVAISTIVGGVAIALGGLFWQADEIEVDARQQLFRDPITHAERSDYQEIVLTERNRISGVDDLRLFLNGDLQFASPDEYRYHESLVHPALAESRERVLILGGGEGLALREVLRYPDVEEVTLVELDPAVLELARENESLRDLNDDALADERVRTVAADAFGWVREQVDVGAEPYDAVIVDMPDPDSTATSKLYSLEFYGMVHDLVADDGRMVLQAGSPFFAPRSFACIQETVQAAGFGIQRYMVSVPSFGDWGFVLAGPAGAEPELRLPDDAPELRYLSPSVLDAATVIPPDKVVSDVEVSTLVDPVILEYTRREWRTF